MSRFLIRSIIAVLGMCSSVSPLFAHKLLLDCRVSDNRLRIEAFYDDDTPAQMAKVLVEGPGKLIVAQGQTNEKGVWSCPAPAPGEYTVRAESAGHAHHETITVEDAQSTPSATSPGQNAVRDQSVGHARHEATGVGDSQSTSSGVRSRKTSIDQITSSEQTPNSKPRPTREEQTETPWLKLAIGLIIIAGGAFVWFTFRGAADRP